jgi:hypothetical protein
MRQTFDEWRWTARPAVVARRCQVAKGAGSWRFCDGTQPRVLDYLYVKGERIRCGHLGRAPRPRSLWRRRHPAGALALADRRSKRSENPRAG